MMTLSSLSSDISNATSSRSAQRKAKLQQIEREQRLEDAEALKLTDEQRHTLFQSFSSVKVEFCDLDGLQWTGSALRKRTTSSRPTVSNPLPRSPNLNFDENIHRANRVRAQSLLSPVSPASPLSSASSYFPSLDTPLATPQQRGRVSGTFTVLNNVDFTSSFDDQTVRAVVSPVKAAFDMQSPTPSARESDRPPAKQQRRARSPVKALFESFEPETPRATSSRSNNIAAPSSAFDGQQTPAPAYSGGAPMERQSSSTRRCLTRTYSEAEITFGVSPSVATEVMRGRERVRGRSDVPKGPEAAENDWSLDEVVESDMDGAGTIRRGPPTRERGRPLGGFGGGPRPKSTSASRIVEESVLEDDDDLKTPTPEMYGGAVEYPTVRETPIQGPRPRADSFSLKRKRQLSNDSQTEFTETAP